MKLHPGANIPLTQGWHKLLQWAVVSSLPLSWAARISPGTPSPPATSQRTDLAGRKPIFLSDEVQCQGHKCKPREGAGVKPGRAGSADHGSGGCSRSRERRSEVLPAGLAASRLRQGPVHLPNHLLAWELLRFSGEKKPNRKTSNKSWTSTQNAAFPSSHCTGGLPTNSTHFQILSFLFPEACCQSLGQTKQQCYLLQRQILHSADIFE